MLQRCGVCDCHLLAAGLPSARCSSAECCGYRTHSAAEQCKACPTAATHLQRCHAFAAHPHCHALAPQAWRMSANWRTTLSRTRLRCSTLASVSFVAGLTAPCLMSGCAVSQLLAAGCCGSSHTLPCTHRLPHIQHAAACPSPRYCRRGGPRAQGGCRCQPAVAGPQALVL